MGLRVQDLRNVVSACSMTGIAGISLFLSISWCMHQAQILQSQLLRCQPHGGARPAMGRLPEIARQVPFLSIMAL
jgi:hypothetical protein